MLKIDIVFYSGSVVFIFGLILIIISKFRNYERIDIKSNLFIIIIYISLMIASIILWKLFCNVLFHISTLTSPDNTFKDING